MSRWMKATAKTLRRKVSWRDGWRCKYCSASLTLATSTLDHVVPKKLGGGNAFENLALACVRCNNAKGCKPPHAFIAERMQGLIA